MGADYSHQIGFVTPKKILWLRPYSAGPSKPMLRGWGGPLDFGRSGTPISTRRGADYAHPHPLILYSSFSPILDARMLPREAGRPERNRLVFFESFFHSLNLLIQLTFAVTIVGNNF